MFSKILVANRGEIARRIMRTCQSLGVATVAVFSDADADEPHVREADESVRLGPAPAGESYLDIGAVVDAAIATGAQAVHPGYGFLAENADFAEACADKGLVFIGPRPESIRLMADKSAAKRHIAEAGVPVIPGVDRDLDDDDAILAAADEIGLPLLVKAVAGGGGKGMRLVDAAADLPEAVSAVRREASAAFGDPRILLEKAVDRPRHIEVQIFGDEAGRVVHLNERECSIQRRHQKIVEETPSPAVDDALRARICASAQQAAEAIGYVGAGTVEMLLSAATGDFYFLEMNTRLQVEHPVTEMTTGVDLVEWQLRIAAGQPLPLTQEEIGIDGHAIEVRLYAEDAAGDFLPQTGDVVVFDVPAGPGVRVDSGVEAGSTVTRHYDPMLAKIIVHDADRESARQRLRSVLAEAAVLGVTTNLGHLLAVVEHPAFAEGEMTTSFLDEHLPDWRPPPIDADDLTAAAVACLRLSVRDDRSPWTRLGPWRLPGTGGWPLALRASDGTDHAMTVTSAGPDELRITPADGQRTLTVRITEALVDGSDVRLQLAVDRRTVRARVVLRGDVVWLHRSGVTRRLTRVPATRHADPGLLTAGEALVSPMPGAVAAVNVSVGDAVKAGRTLVVVEAMKMEHPVKAPIDGVVRAVHVETGDAVDSDQPLVEVEPHEDDDADDDGAPR